jgi:RES domain-containing protein
MNDIDLEAFEEYFYRDLEKWFSADIACCDHCYDDFLSMWPHADYADECYFQTQSIGLDCFYSGSYLQDYYSKAEFDRFIAKIPCPRCGSPLGWNIWAYNLPFDVPRDFEATIIQVSELARSTPFLLLEHNFCQKVLSSIRDLSKAVVPAPFGATLFRARSINKADLPQHILTFDFPPPPVVQEGRYNHAGAPVLYLASDKETCLEELRNSPCLVLEFELLPPIRVLDLTDPFGAHEKHADLLNCLVYSALASAKQIDDGWHKPHYVVSRYVADCARAAGFDAIKYPSTRRTVKNFNLVLVNTSIPLAKSARVISYHQMDSA